MAENTAAMPGRKCVKWLGLPPGASFVQSEKKKGRNMGQKIKVKPHKHHKKDFDPARFYLGPSLEGVTVTVISDPLFWKPVRRGGIELPPPEFIQESRYLRVYKELAKRTRKQEPRAAACSG
jgi:hypothetical protein